jgi:hypothetical protein
MHAGESGIICFCLAFGRTNSVPRCATADAALATSPCRYQLGAPANSLITIYLICSFAHNKGFHSAESRLGLYRGAGHSVSLSSYVRATVAKKIKTNSLTAIVFAVIIESRFLVFALRLIAIAYDYS